MSALDNNYSLKVDKLSKSFNDIKVLDNLSFEIQFGEIVSIVGQSGTGKTTLLKILAGLTKPDSGIIEKKYSTSLKLSNKIGYSPQKPILFEWFNLYDNVNLPLTLNSLSNIKVSKEEIKDLLKLLKIWKYKDLYPSELSGGIYQRAALARTLVYKPSIVLLDESFNALDEFTREGLWIDLLNIWRKKGCTVLIVTHSIKEAIALSNRVLTMSKDSMKIEHEVIINRQKIKNDFEFNDSFMEYYKIIKNYLR